MTKVKTLKEHRNVHGIHKDGDEYDHDAPEMDIHFGYVELVEPTIDELKAEAEDRNIELPKKGSGKDGAVIKADIKKAVEKAG